MSDERVYVVARSVREAKDYIMVMSYKEPGFRDRARIVTRHGDLMGTRKSSVHLIGYYGENRDWGQIRCELVFRDHICVEVQDWR